MARLNASIILSSLALVSIAILSSLAFIDSFILRAIIASLATLASFVLSGILSSLALIDSFILRAILASLATLVSFVLRAILVSLALLASITKSRVAFICPSHSADSYSLVANTRCSAMMTSFLLQEKLKKKLLTIS